MSKTINYQAEVKKVYPDAFLDWNEKLQAGSVYLGYFVSGGGRFPKRICSMESNDINVAWKSAYNKLKQSGKI